MTSDFYCDEALSGKTPVKVVLETEDVLAFHHTKPYWPVHIVVVPKVHIPSFQNLSLNISLYLVEITAKIQQYRLNQKQAMTANSKSLVPKNSGLLFRYLLIISRVGDSVSRSPEKSQDVGRLRPLARQVHLNSLSLIVT